FGVSGTNAHVILEQAPPTSEARPGPVAIVPLVLSAKTPTAVRAQAERLLPLLDRHEPVDLAWSLATGRAALAHRAVVVGRDRDDLTAGLRAVMAGDTPVVEAEPHGRVAFLFSGQGSQRAGMGRELHAGFPVFAEAFDEACAHIDPLLEHPLRDVVFGGGDLLGRTEFAQPALFAMGVALTRLLASFGVRPDAVLGHSVGEITAACASGALSLGDAARLVVARGTLMRDLPPGVMVAVEATEHEVAAHLGAGVDLAAVNGARAVVLSGDPAPVRAAADHFAALGRRTKALAVAHAYHSAHVEHLLAEFATRCAGLVPGDLDASLVSGLTGARVDAATLASPDHWARLLREPVRFADGVEALRGQGITRFVDLGPDGTLAALVDHPGATAVAVLRGARPEATSFTTALADLHAAGVPVSWRDHLAGARAIDLPTYPFQRTRHWLTRSRPAEQTPVDDWAYRATWTPIATSGSPTGRWLAVTATPDLPELPGIDAVHFPVSAEDDRVSMARRLVDIPPVDGVVSLLAVGERFDPAAPEVPRSLVATLALTQALGDAGVDARLWIATRGAVAAEPADGLPGVGQAALWGLARVVAAELPRRWGGIVDLPGTGSFERLAGVLAGGTDQVAVRGDRVLGKRLARTRLTTTTPWRPRGSVLVTGGTGALGAHVARWLARNGAAHLVLAGRRGEADRALVDELTTRGVTVQVEACDVADRDALAALLGRIPAEHPLTGVVHAAGVLDDSTIDNLTPAQVERALRAKLLGSVTLHELTEHLRLDAFVLFSSIGATFGSYGQANYAPGNAVLDALAAHRRAAGLPGTSIAWGPWAGGGMGESVRRLEDWNGVLALTPDHALDAFGHAVLHPDAHLVIADITWSRLLADSARPDPLYADLPEARSTPAETTLRDPHAAVSAVEPAQQLHDHVRTVAAAISVTPHPPPSPPTGRANRLRLALRRRAAQPADRAQTSSSDPTVVFDHPTARALAEFLDTEPALPAISSRWTCRWTSS
ncbi:SDR family NAD(P)-dependent oxidoreductase, partial [Saccharothrix sp. MB29]|nr:SDR family NAD(P)-dependent oxidoreductase [Saccharothrix sp. MB29]